MVGMNFTCDGTVDPDLESLEGPGCRPWRRFTAQAERAKIFELCDLLVIFFVVHSG